MTVTLSDFTANFPEFSDVSVYPAAQFAFWYGVAGNVLDPERWGALLDTGAQLYVAHNLVLGAQAANAAAFGGPPGIAAGPLASKAVDKVSASYAVAEAVEEGGGQYNTTTYGQRFFALSMMIGAGGAQL